MASSLSSWLPSVDRRTMMVFACTTTATVCGAGLAMFVTNRLTSLVHAVGAVVGEVRATAEILQNIALADHMARFIDYTAIPSDTGFSWARTYDMMQDVRGTAENARDVAMTARTALCDREMPPLTQAERIAQVFRPQQWRDALSVVIFVILLAMVILLVLLRLLA